MWHNLATLSISMNNLSVAERCFAALGDVAKSHYLKETIEISKNDPNGLQSPTVWARMAILNNDLKIAENIYLEQGNLEDALQMYQKYHKWDEALILAEQRAYHDFDNLKQTYMKFLLKSNQQERAAQILETQGDLDQALELYLKSNRPARAARIIQQNSNYLNNDDLVMKVTKMLLRNELYESAAELYHAVGHDDLAIQFYRKGIFPCIVKRDILNFGQYINNCDTLKPSRKKPIVGYETHYQGGNIYNFNH